MLVAALTGANAILPDMMNLHRERTADGVTVVVAPGDGPVTVEAWIGGGLGDELGGDAVGDAGHERTLAGMAHLGEHVALAMAGARLRERGIDRVVGRVAGRVAGRVTVGLDGWVTPDATVFRAIAPAGAGAGAGGTADVVRSAVEAVALAAVPRGDGDGGGGGGSAMTEWMIARERERIAREGEGEGEGVAASRGGVREVEAWWARSYDPARTTVAVRGARVDEAVAAIEDGWRRTGIGARRTEIGERRAEIGERRVGIGARGAVCGARDVGQRWRRRGIDVSRADVREQAALAIAAAAMRVQGDAAELIVTRNVVMWIAAARLDELDDALFAWARAAVRVPLAGVETALGEIAAGQHVFGDPRWATRWRAAVAAVTRDDVPRAVRTHLGRGVVRAARRAPVTPPRATTAPRVVKRATLANGARVVAVRVPGAERVAVRVAWSGGFAAEGPADRGVVALLAAAAPASCGAIDVAAETAALGGELAGVAGRWTFGLRSRWTKATWKEGLALVAACAHDPELDHDVVARERARLVTLATDVARSPARVAFQTYLHARWAGDPLALDALAVPGELAALTRAGAAEWWRAHYAPSAAVVVVVGDVDPDAAIAEVRERFRDSARPAAATPATPATRAAAAPRVGARATPPLPEQRQLFVDGPDGAAALVIGLPGLAAGDADRRLVDGLVAILADPAGRLRRAATANGMRVVRVAAVAGPAAGYVVIELGGAPPADAALVAIADVLRALAGDGPTAAEVAVAAAALAPPDEPLAIADAAARAELRATGEPAPSASPAAVPDAAALQRVAAAVLRWDDAMIVTVRPPAMTPGARAHATKRVPPRRRAIRGKR